MRTSPCSMKGKFSQKVQWQWFRPTNESLKPIWVVKHVEYSEPFVFIWGDSGIGRHHHGDAVGPNHLHSRAQWSRQDNLADEYHGPAAAHDRRNLYGRERCHGPAGR